MQIYSINSITSYNQSNIKFLGKNKIPNLDNWIKENYIHERTLASYYKLFEVQKNNPVLMSQIHGLIPKIASTKYESYNLSENLGGGVSENITQILNLYKKGKLMAKYGVEYDSQGNITDDFFINTK